MSRVLVTGGCGFLGHAVVRALIAEGHLVTVMSSRADAKPATGAELVVADLRVPDQVAEAVRAAGPDCVCHLSALTQVRDSFERPLDYFEVNVAGTVNYGDGSALREFSHVADVAKALVMVLDTNMGESRTFNVGSGIECSMAEVVQAVREVTGREVLVEHRPPQPEPQTLSADSTALRAQVGWAPRYTDLRDLVKDAWEAVTEACL